MTQGKYNFGIKSQLALSGCDFRLRAVAEAALAYGLMDFAVIEGHRPDRLQHEYFLAGKSKQDAGDPNAKHCRQPAEAMDCVPYVDGQISWNHLHCCILAGFILAAALQLGYRLRWGGNWDMDGEPVTDQEFQDLVHYEIMNV